jgi:hypothetical protein
MLSKTEDSATIVRVADADLVGSATLVTVTVTVTVDGTLAGARYTPLFEIVPQDAPVQAEPLSNQVTAAFEFPVTVPVNC